MIKLHVISVWKYFTAIKINKPIINIPAKIGLLIYCFSGFHSSGFLANSMDFRLFRLWTMIGPPTPHFVGHNN
jgi:hypothetical protein